MAKRFQLPPFDAKDPDSVRYALEQIEIFLNGTVPTIEADVAGLDGTYQPLDADLTAIAALNTDAFGRGLLTDTTAAEVREGIAALGGLGNYVDFARALDTVYQPNAVRATFVAGGASINNGAGEQGSIVATVGPTSTPTQTVWIASSSAGGQLLFPFGFIVPPAYYFKLSTSTVSGSPAYGLFGGTYELTL